MQSDDRQRQSAPRYYAKAENADLRLELELEKKKERQALLILHVSSRGGGAVPNRAIGMAVNGAEPPPPSGQASYRTTGRRFFCNIPKAWLLEGHNVVEVWDVLTGLRASTSIYFEEEKKPTLEEEEVKRLQTQLEQKKLKKQVEAVEKLPTPAEKRLAAVKVAAEQAKAEKELREATKTPSAEEEKLKQKKLEAEIAEAERKLTEATRKPALEEEGVKLLKLKLERAKAEKELAEFSQLSQPDPETEALEQQLARLTLAVQVQQLSNQLLQLKGQVPSAKRAACVYCGQALPSDTFQCKNCGSLQADFARLCEHCGKEIDSKADECVHCKQRFPTLIGSTGAAYIVCGYCVQNIPGYRGRQLDDWTWEKRIPLLVKTRRGVKLASFPSPQKAAAVRLRFFWPHGPIPVDIMVRRLEASDEEKWQFTSDDTAKEFVSRFPCICGHAAWSFSKAEYAKQKLIPPAKKAAIAAGGTILEWIKKKATKRWQGGKK